MLKVMTGLRFSFVLVLGWMDGWMDGWMEIMTYFSQIAVLDL